MTKNNKIIQEDSKEKKQLDSSEETNTTADENLIYKDSKKEENGLVKFVKSLRLFEWIIILVVVVFASFFVYNSLKPKVKIEDRVVDPAAKVRLYEFWGNGCPHCAKAAPFLKNLDRELKELEVYDYEVWYDTQNQAKQKKVADALGVEAKGVPYIVIGDEVIEGFDDEESTGGKIKERVNYCIQNECPDKAGEVLGLSKLQFNK